MPRKSGNDKLADIYDQLITDIENGSPPWQVRWSNTTGSRRLPYNLLTDKQYHGSNILLLMYSQRKQGFVYPAWITFKQKEELAEKYGATILVRAGERSSGIVRYEPWLDMREYMPAEGYGIEEYVIEKATGNLVSYWKATIPIIRTYRVFNVEQLEGVPDEILPMPSPQPPVEVTLLDCLDTLNSLGVDLRHAGDRCYYAPAHDHITMAVGFDDEIRYWQTLFHELIHWTAHAERAGRVPEEHFSTDQEKSYAFEEMVAEIGASFLCASHGLDYDSVHATYVDHYAKILEHDPKLLMTASKLAEEAHDFIMGKKEAKHSSNNDVSNVA